jgi:hypothetical protein
MTCGSPKILQVPCSGDGVGGGVGGGGGSGGGVSGGSVGLVVVVVVVETKKKGITKSQRKHNNQ